MLVIAHRGGKDRYPELTLAAARHSLEAGADYVELDIRFAKDGVPVISHDDDALHLFGHPAKIAELTAEEYCALRYTADNRFRPHTLEEVLTGGIAPILFHIKEGGKRLGNILTAVRAHGYERKVVMGVSTLEDVAAVKAFDPDMMTLAFMPAKEKAADFMGSGVDVIRLWEDWVEEPLIASIHAAGKQVWIMAGSTRAGVVGVTAPDNLLKWKRMGADGVLIDHVVEALSLLRSN